LGGSIDLTAAVLRALDDRVLFLKDLSGINLAAIEVGGGNAGDSI
jgi:hypothetical protein